MLKPQAEVCLREGQIGCHRVAAEGRFLNLCSPISLIDFQANNSLTVQLLEIELFIVKGSVLLINSLL
jgi:hypothetical protein